MFYLKECIKYGMFLEAPKETFGSLNLSIRSVMSKLKQKYEIDTKLSSENIEDNKYDRLLYLRDLNADFIQLQKEYENFKKTFF